MSLARPRVRRLAGTAVVAAILLALGTTPAPAAPASPAAAVPAAPVTVSGSYVEQEACAQPASPDVARCFAVAKVPAAAVTRDGGRVVTPQTAAPSTQLTSPTELRAAYGVRNLSTPGTTVAIVVAYDAPAVESDLAAFRAYYGMPACTTANGCFRKVDQRGATVPVGKPVGTAPVPDAGWLAETTLDTQAVSAICPSCHLLVVEADSAGLSQLGAAVDQAVALGAGVVTNSYGVPERNNGAVVATAYYDSQFYDHPGVAVIASTGDSGWDNYGDTDPTVQGVPNYPASSAHVLAVGGTTLRLSSGTVAGETAWSGSGSGCSVTVARSPWQTQAFVQRGVVPGGSCSVAGVGDGPPVPARATADVAALADPDVGLAVYRAGASGGPWVASGGTSLAAPIIAGLQALAGVPAAGAYASQYPSAAAAGDLVDVTSGSNQLGGPSCGGSVCVAGRGWDGPTGLGAPRGVGAFSHAALTGPATAAPGQTALTVKGTHFAAGETVQFTLDPSGPAPAGVRATSAGAITVRVQAPITSATSVTLTATGSTSGRTATWTIALPAAALSVAPASAPPGTRVTVAGTGFVARAQVTVSAPGASPVRVRSTTTGTFTATLVTGSTTGDSPVTATDSTRTATAPFTVTPSGAS